MAKTRVKKSFWRILAELVFPVLCVECGREGDWLCADCLRTAELVRPEQCSLCRKAATNGLCDKCRLATGLEGVVCLFNYHDSSIQKLIKALKYGGQTDVARFIAEKYRRQILRQLPDNDLTVTFVPLSHQRQATRGFNQAELWARLVVCDEFQVAPLVNKVRPTVPQASLDKEDRAKNLRGAFALATKAVPERVVVFDDVVTTGATLSTIAKLLKKKGCLEIWAVTIAHD